MSKVNKMNVYVSNLAILNTKLHNLHWNVEGLQFKAIHDFTEDIYNDFFSKFDDVAEQLKILGENPLATTQEYLDNSTVDEIQPKAFSPKEVLAILKSDLELMKDLAAEIRNAADAENDFTTVSMFEDHVASYSKTLWFINSMNK